VGWRGETIVLVSGSCRAALVSLEEASNFDKGRSVRRRGFLSHFCLYYRVNIMYLRPIMGYARPPNPRISKSIRHMAYITLNPTLHPSVPDLAITAATSHSPQPLSRCRRWWQRHRFQADMKESKVKKSPARRRHDGTFTGGKS
jgi:hypothetical protein